jgi:hypothetical protein
MWNFLNFGIYWCECRVTGEWGVINCRSGGKCGKLMSIYRTQTGMWHFSRSCQERLSGTSLRQAIRNTDVRKGALTCQKLTSGTPANQLSYQNVINKEAHLWRVWTHGRLVDSGIMLQAGRSLFRFPMRSLVIEIGFIIPAARLPSPVNAACPKA